MSGLFTPAFDALEGVEPETIRRVESAQHQLLMAGTKPPTNAQILQAARSTYEAHQPAVDANTTSGIGYVTTPPNRPTVATLNAYDWKSQQAAPITPTASTVFAADAMQSGVDAAHADADIWSMVIGVSESGQVIIGEEGGIGIAFGLAANGGVQGAGYVAGKLGLDIDAALNLQVGLWNAPPSQLGGAFYGLEVNLDLEVGVSLGVFVSGDKLQYVGFSIGVGVGVGGGVTVVGGHTWVF